MNKLSLISTYASHVTSDEGIQHGGGGAGKQHGGAHDIQGVRLKVGDVVKVMMYLANDESRYVSGHNFVMDRQFLTRNPLSSLACYSISKHE